MGMYIIISIVTFVIGGLLVWLTMRYLLKSRYDSILREAEKEAERTVPEASKEKPKTPEANRQTVHRQPKKSKKPKER